MRFKGQDMTEIKGDSVMWEHVRELQMGDYPTRRYAYQLSGTVWAIKDEAGVWRYFTITY